MCGAELLAPTDEEVLPDERAILLRGRTNKKEKVREAQQSTVRDGGGAQHSTAQAMLSCSTAHCLLQKCIQAPTNDRKE